MTIHFTVTAVIPAPPQEVYDHWLDSQGHSRMTGSPAQVSDRVGGTFSAWDGYISGRNLKLEPGRRIVQCWRGTGYQEADDDSQIDVLLEAVDGGTLVTLTHTNVPDDQGSHEPGWTTHYFEPMQRYFRRKAALS